MPATPPCPYGGGDDDRPTTGDTMKLRVIIVATSLAFGALLGAVATTLISDEGSASRPPTAETSSATAAVHHACSSRVPTDCAGP
jgi:hypothetical protein